MRWYTKSRRAQSSEDYETWVEGGVMPTLNAFDNGDVRTTIIIFHPHYHDGARVQGDTMNTLTSRMGTGGNNVSCVATVVTTTADVVGSLQARDYKGVGNQYVAENKLVIAVPIHDKATRFAGKRQMHDGTYKEDGAGNGLGIGKEGDPMNTLTGGDRHAVFESSTVRRLTPIECERLQGFPDDWTAGQPDSTRYKQMGNAVAVPVVEWIIQGICDTI
jgi:DNA (cytosine-5)-methyltransferase 1